METITLYPLWKQAVENFLALPHAPGAIIKKSWLADEFGLKAPETAQEQKDFEIEFMRSFNQFRDSILKGHNVCLKTLYNGAYEVVAPQAQTEHAEQVHIKAVHRELSLMMNKMRHVDFEALTDEERRRNADALARAAQLKQTVRGRRQITMTAKRIK
jgi:hypothetical protein